ncbi:MAG: HAMP domain-containing histidine kinase [Alphaproteobacteria bacterium]|nr:HAMP domain-containing histidine kinase [Alphaproteobacteria bacterium]
MRLSDFICFSVNDVMLDYEHYLCEYFPALNNESRSAIRNDMQSILLHVAQDMKSKQSSLEQEQKSKGDKAPHATNTTAHNHGELRVEQGLDIVSLNAEYRFLRANILGRWQEHINSFELQDYYDIIRFNEAIDEVQAESLKRYHEVIEDARTTFLGILGHDIRNPLGAISGMADMLVRMGELTDKQLTLTKEIKRSALHIGAITDNLLELTRIQMGSMLSIYKESCKIRKLCNEAVEETRQAYPTVDIQLSVANEISCALDSMRIQQMLANLLRNAIQHGDKSQAIQLEAFCSENSVCFKVHNKGSAIPENKIKNIFDKYSLPSSLEPTRNLGLGLYIVSQIVAAHEGKITVTSTAQAGTTFTILIPC